MSGRRRLLVALALWLASTLALAIGHRDVGYVRDEGIYFAASRQYAAWLGDLGRDAGKAWSKAGRDRRFRVNHEHPALLKTLAGISAAMLARPPVETAIDEDVVDTGGVMPVMDEGAAMRLPAQVLFGALVAMLFLAAASGGSIAAGLVAAGGFALQPHVWFHAGLHAFDVPVAAAIFAVVLAYRRAQLDRRWAVAAGVLLGVAIAMKHNALFVGPLLALHHWTTLSLAKWRDGRRIAPAQWIPFPLWSMAILGVLVAWALWPWMWADPATRLVEYFDFHRQHAYYNMEFLGANYNQPPMPISYPFVMTFATVSTVWLVLVVAGAWIGLRGDLRRQGAPEAETREGSFWVPLGGGIARRDGLLYLIFAAFPIVLIALPTTPIFGGTKHWITAYPFFAMLGAMAWSRLWAAVDRGDGSTRALARWQPAAVAIVLLPGATATIGGHPSGMSQYVAAVGGARGAASLGLGRGFWGHAIGRELAALPEHTGGARRLYVHDVHDLAVLQYRREGRWPASLEPAPLGRAQAGLFFHELHMATWEYQLWERLGTAAPRHVITLDGVPLVSVYGSPSR
jgi:hypothetical protein